jgi:hypothetical protein
MLVRKTNPVGIDEMVDIIQEALDALQDFGNVTWDNFPRAYKNPKALKQGTYVPEVYDGSGEYLECLMNDGVVLTTFFVSDGSREFAGDDFTSPLSLIVQCSNLEAIYPGIAHRADEELIHGFLTILRSISDIQIESIDTTIEDVYSEFDTENLRFDDMGVFFVFRVNMTATYGLSCCSDC